VALTTIVLLVVDYSKLVHQSIPFCNHASPRRGLFFLHKKSAPEDAHKSTNSDHVYNHTHSTRSNYQNNDDILDIHDILYRIRNDILGIYDDTLNTFYDGDSNLDQNQHSFFINPPYYIYYIICCFDKKCPSLE
jgi:hypothetical protein